MDAALQNAGRKRGFPMLNSGDLIRRTSAVIVFAYVLFALKVKIDASPCDTVIYVFFIDGVFMLEHVDCFY